jgi:DNA mismatch repair ATPase MutS
LKQVVDAAERSPGEFLFLLDEILHGTNTAERRIAARTVIAHLVGTGALGAVTTHDLDLLGQELEPLAVPVHFTEQFLPDGAGGERMTFDYLLRPGLAQSKNALKLMQIVGIRVNSKE